MAMRLGLLCLTVVGLQAQATPSGKNCTFRNDPDEYLQRVSRDRAALAAQTKKLAGARFASAARTIDANELPRRSFIDAEIFDRLTKEGVPSARLTTDEEFVRRIYLDLTGRLPSSAEVRKFVDDSATDKRSSLIDSLLYSPAFAARWTCLLYTSDAADE